ncbi:aldehyde dehydrogenase family 16 member A1-like isoform X2 [Culicoides brevitarsis]|uniref:aldehyde dehydrogenase family 16 member A1-like isoform X2 n=1 Tax=Culicoides brevitarsis TaxID=469753 RepID=UPI00307BF6F9
MTSLFEKFKNMEMDDKSFNVTDKKTFDQEETFSMVWFKSKLTSAELYEELLKQKQTLINNFFENGYAPMAAIEEEFDLALEFMKNAKLATGRDISKYFVNGLSLFQLLIELYCSSFANESAAAVHPSLKEIFEIMKFEKTSNFLTSSGARNSSYGTLIVTETADLHCALDEIVKTFRNLHNSWRIRKILVQECVKEKFFTLLEKNLPKIDGIYGKNRRILQEFEASVATLQEKGVKLTHRKLSDGDVLKATLAFGVPMSHLSQEKAIPVIAVDTFRTAKEGIALANKEGNGEFVSVWSENVTEAFEYAKLLKFATVWINCHGVFHPKMPFKVNSSEYNFTLDPKALTVKAYVPQGTKDLKPFPDISPPYQQSFFEKSFFYTVTSEKREKLLEVIPKSHPEVKTEDRWVKDGATMFNYEYKSIIVRYGQTFAN